MTNSPRAAHLDAAEIDRYVHRRVSDREEAEIEAHYLDCHLCELKVRGALDRLDLLGAPHAVPRADHIPASARGWQLATAALAVVAVIAGWQWARLASAVPTPAAAVTRGSEPPAGTLTVALAPPTRSARTLDVSPAGAAIVVFELDVREASAPGTLFNVSLTARDDRLLLRLEGVTSNQGGVVFVPIDARMLASGTYVFRAAGGGSEVSLPFRITGP